MIVCAGLPLVARAQATANDKAAAQRLYEHGYMLMEEGKVAEGCTELEKSQSIESSIGTMMYLAFCYEQLGRTASAWAM